MLIEAFLALTAETSPALRRLGLVGDAVALWSRATRRARAWAPHEKRARATVARAVEAVGHGRTALVLGSGLLRDVPVDLLAERFDRVLLLDAVHLWPARRRARRLGADRRVIDLTGLAGELTGLGPAEPDPLARFKADDAVDLVVSACVLSQLAHAPARRPSPSGQPEDWPARLVARHLADLADFRARLCLVSDVAFSAVGRDGTVAGRTDLLGGLVLPAPDEAWDWEVAPRGEIDRAHAYRHHVQGYADFGAALRRDGLAGHDGRDEGR